ncbi:MAG TPA: tetratricopeptide repeat protein, partial [Candidatus Obscuribacterales bacterium]
MSEETGSNQKEDEALVRARELLADGRLEECLSVLKTYWLNNPADPQAALLFSQLMSEAGRGELSTKLEKLSEKLINGSSEKQDATISGADDKGSPQELFEAGYGLIDIRQHELAAMLLNRAVNLLPDEPVINYELGFSLMSLGRFQKAIPYFEQAAKLQEDFDTCLNLAVCLTMTRRSQEARDLLKRLEKLAHSDEEKKELAHRAVVLRRLDTLKSKTQLSLRDWLYILYGSIMINPKPPAGREDYQSIAATLAVLKGVLEGLRTEIEAVEYYSPYSKPLAQILGELMELPMDSYKGPARPDRALLVMSWASDIIGP